MAQRKSIFGRIWDAIKSLFGFGKIKKLEGNGDDYASIAARGQDPFDENATQGERTEGMKLVDEAYDKAVQSNNGGLVKVKPSQDAVLPKNSKTTDSAEKSESEDEYGYADDIE